MLIQNKNSDLICSHSFNHRPLISICSYCSHKQYKYHHFINTKLYSVIHQWYIYDVGCCPVFMVSWSRIYVSAVASIRGYILFSSNLLFFVEICVEWNGSIAYAYFTLKLMNFIYSLFVCWHSIAYLCVCYVMLVCVWMKYRRFPYSLLRSCE